MPFTGSPSPAVLAPTLGYSEIRPGFTRRWRSAVKNVRNQSAYARVLILGDSNVAGAGAGTGGSFNYNGAATRGFPPRLPTSELPYRFSSFAGGQFVDPTVAFTTFDTRWAFSGGAQIWNPGTVISGSAITCAASTTGVATFMLGQPFDRAEVIFVSASGNSAATVTAASAGGGSETLGSIVGNQATAMRSTGALACSTPRDSLAINFASGGGLPISGVITWSNGVKEVHVMAAGWAGGTIANVAQNAQVFYSLPAVAAFNADLVLVNGLTLNDASAGTTTSAWQTSAQTIIDTVRAQGSDIAWITGLNVETDASNATNLALNRTLRQVCQLNNVSLLDMHERWRPQAQWAPNASYYYNSRHPSYLGYGDYAAMIARFCRLIAEGQAD